VILLDGASSRIVSRLDWLSFMDLIDLHLLKDSVSQELKELHEFAYVIINPLVLSPMILQEHLAGVGVLLFQMLLVSDRVVERLYLFED